LNVLSAEAETLQKSSAPSDSRQEKLNPIARPAAVTALRRAAAVRACAADIEQK